MQDTATTANIVTATVTHTPTPTPTPTTTPQPTKTGQLKTTPILGLLPTHSEAEIDARYLGYVQGVQQEAAEATTKLHKTTAEPIAKAAQVRDASIAEARKAFENKERGAEQKYQRLLKALKTTLASRKQKNKNALDAALAAARKTFSDVAIPAGEELKVQLFAVENNARIKLTNAGAEHTKAMSFAKARRLKAEAEEKAQKEADEALRKSIEAEKAANENESVGTVVPAA
jgi:hypothetical protein